MAQKYCSGCGNHVMQTMLICPQCGARSFSTSPVAINVQEQINPVQTNTYSQVSLNPKALSLGASKASSYSGFWERLASCVIDATVATFLSVTIGVIVWYLITVLFNFPTTPRVQAFIKLCAILIVLFYYAGMESGERSATFGKQLLGIKVLDLNYQRISFGRATQRYFGRWISMLTIFIGYLIQPFTANRQTLHDIMSGTVVIKDVGKSKSIIEIFAILIVSTMVLSILLFVIEVLSRSIMR